MNDEILSKLDSETLSICIRMLREILDEICNISEHSEERLVVSEHLDRLIVDYMRREPQQECQVAIND